MHYLLVTFAIFAAAHATMYLPPLKVIFNINLNNYKTGDKFPK